MKAMRNIRMRKRAEEDLKRSHMQLRALTARMLTSREEERTRISREIHDEFGEVLTALKLGLAWMQTRLSAQDHTIPWGEVFAKMDALRSLANGTAKRVRKFCTELRPPVLDNLGLAPAIEWEAKEFKARTNIRCEVTQQTDSWPIGQEQATAVFRIFQEVLTNIARHANASRVSVELKTTGSNLVLKVQDNGKGINLSAATDGLSLGILGMRERATLLGGELQIHGTPGRGTTVTLSLPLEPLVPNVESRPQGPSKTP
jgi:signal transduction histidine kinase